MERLNHIKLSSSEKKGIYKRVMKELCSSNHLRQILLDDDNFEEIKKILDEDIN